MVVLKPQKVIRALKKKSFKSFPGDHTRLILFVNGKKTEIKTKVSHGSQEINDYLIGRMASQLKLDKKGFLDYVSCTKTTREYIEELGLAQSLSQ